MFDRSFGMPQHVVRTGLWAKLKPSEQNLYVCLMHESERFSTRTIRRNDAALCRISGLSSRAFCNARKKLQEFRLIECHRGVGNIYVYTISNPETGIPWPGSPKERITYRRKVAQEHEKNIRPNNQSGTSEGTEGPEFTQVGSERRANNGQGIPLDFH